ncbi:MAG TPA: transposase, partial [Actinomycetota bacterium]|nr:transposase [Actinomycetota bacterium]
ELARLGPDAPELLVATQRAPGEPPRAPIPPRGRIPKDLSPRDRMDRKLTTKRGRRLFARRAVIAEPLYGEVKGPRRAGRFIRRGLSACENEWRLVCTTNNLLKLWRHRRNGGRPAG